MKIARICRHAFGAIALLVLASCASAPSTRVEPQPPPRAAAPANPRPTSSCPDCGHVERIETLQGMRATPKGGAVLGGVVGGVLSAPSKPAATAAKPGQAMYRVTLRMLDGRRLVVNQNTLPAALRVGSAVLFRGGRLILVH